MCGKLPLFFSQVKYPGFISSQHGCRHDHKYDQKRLTAQDAILSQKSLDMFMYLTSLLPFLRDVYESVI
ncbi:unnamed protein product [Heterobilharzia americana]|nr:unnamed protein product [Heterobilharzia americana]